MSVVQRSENAPGQVNFDHVARPYRWLEYLSFGPWLGRCRIAQLAHLTSARHALLLGDGDGRFLARMLAADPLLSVDVVDSSYSMLTVLDRRIRRSGAQARQRICLHHADALGVEPHRKVRPDRFSLLPRLLFPLPIGATLRSRPSPCSSGGAMGYLGVRHSPECFCGISRARNHRLALSRLRSGYWASRAHAAGLRDLFTPPWPHPEPRAPLPRRPLVFPGLVGARPFHRDET